MSDSLEEELSLKVKYCKWHLGFNTDKQLLDYLRKDGFRTAGEFAMGIEELFDDLRHRRIRLEEYENAKLGE